MTGTEIKAARLRLGLSQQLVGALIGLPLRSARSRIYDFEQGRRPITKEIERALGAVFAAPKHLQDELRAGTWRPDSFTAAYTPEAALLESLGFALWPAPIQREGEPDRYQIHLQRVYFRRTVRDVPLYAGESVEECLASGGYTQFIHYHFIQFYEASHGIKHLSISSAMRSNALTGKRLDSKLLRPYVDFSKGSGKGQETVFYGIVKSRPDFIRVLQQVGFVQA